MGSMTYDSRVLRWVLAKSEVSIWTMTGRQKMPFVCGERQRQMLETLQGEADLVYRNGEWYLHQPCNILEDDGFDPDEWLGVDLGIVNIATTSDGATFTGADVLGVRKRRRRQRKRLQAKTTSSARRVFRTQTPQGAPDFAGLMAGAVVSMVPTLLLYFLAGRKAIDSIQFSGIK